MMLEDPDAAEFLEGIMPGDGEQQFQSVVVAQLKERREASKTIVQQKKKPK